MTTVTDSAGLARVCPICGGPSGLGHPGLFDDRYGHPGLYDWLRCRRYAHAFINANFTADELERLYSVWYPRATQRYEDLPPLARTDGFKAWLNGERHAAHSWVFWDPKRSPKRLRRGVRTSARLLDKAKAFHLVTRVADGLGIGDNLLAILVKPAQP